MRKKEKIKTLQLRNHDNRVRRKAQTKEHEFIILEVTVVELGNVQKYECDTSIKWKQLNLKTL